MLHVQSPGNGLSDEENANAAQESQPRRDAGIIISREPGFISEIYFAYLPDLTGGMPQQAAHAGHRQCFLGNALGSPHAAVTLPLMPETLRMLQHGK